MQGRFRNRAVIALGMAMMLGTAPRVEAKSTPSRQKFISILAANANSAQTDRLVRNLDRATTNLERQIARQEGGLSGAIGLLARLRPGLANQPSFYYRSRVARVIVGTNRLTAQFRQLSALVTRYSTIAPGRAGRHVDRENQLALASTPLYSRVNAFAQSVGLERSVATPFAPSSSL